MVEFAFVVVLLIALLYGIISYGLILAAQSTITQAAADAARSGIVSSTNAVTAAEMEAGADVSWMDKGPCYERDVVPPGSPNAPISCTAVQETCPSSVTGNTCIKVTVSYNYAASPLFPEMPGLGIITPSTISATDVLQLSTPTS